MLPILHRPMIEQVLDHLARYGIDRGRAVDGLPARRVHRGVPRRRVRGSQAPLRGRARAPRHRRCHPLRGRWTAGSTTAFLVVNGDVLTDLDIAELVALPRGARRRGAPSRCTRSRTRRRSASCRPTTTAGCWPSSRSRRRGEAPTDLINAGTYVLEPSVLDRIAGRPAGVDRARDVPGHGRPTGGCTRCAADAYWIDAGTPRPYLQAQLDLLDGLRGTRCSGDQPRPPCVAAVTRPSSAR